MIKMLEIEKLFDLSQEIKKADLLVVLKEEVSNIHITDIMRASTFLKEDAKYVQASYREGYMKAYVEGFILRITDLKNDKSHHGGYVDLDEFKKALKLLGDQRAQLEIEGNFDPCFSKLYVIMSIYTSFVLEEPIHVVGTPFPGGFEVKFQDGEYLCPVKDKQKDNPGAVCGFCIAKQEEGV
jgi:uncharacterized protein (UPF0305 family)